MAKSHKRKIIELKPVNELEGILDKKTDDTATTQEEQHEGEDVELKNSAASHEKASNEDAVDSSDEEDIRNTVGNIPMEWFKEYEHIGYNLLGRKIAKPKEGDELDEFLEKNDNPDYWRTVVDRSTCQKVVLTDEDIKLVRSLVKGKYSNPTYDPYEPWVDFFTHEKMIHPVTNHPEHKRSFIPSKWERKRVGQLVAAIKMGWIKLDQPQKKQDEQPKYYDLWQNSEESEISKRFRHHIPAPPKPLPGHAESYNPPPEYLLTEEEKKAWEEKEPEERRTNFIPQKYSSMRLVPAYPRFINELFERCLDLYLCPRQRKQRVEVNPEDLIPKLPKPKDLQPFPTTLALIYKGHSAPVRSISIDPTGQWFVSGSQDGTVKLWELSTGRCMRTVNVGAAVKDVAWNPNSSFSLIAVAISSSIIILNSQLGDRLVISKTDEAIKAADAPAEDDAAAQKVSATWNIVDSKTDFKDGMRLKVTHTKEVNQVVWHRQGDYFAVVLDKAETSSVVIHRLSKRQSQRPFTSLKGDVQCVQFHPTAPHFFVATKISVYKYNLLKQEMTKKLFTNCKWVSSMAVHPQGDHVIVGSYDRKLSWFDLDLSTKPYQILKNQNKAIRQVCYHRRYPLFASASADGSVIVYHGRVYDDLLQNPLIVPVKILHCHSSASNADIGTLDCEFHPNQPWILTCGIDNTIKLFS